MNGEGLVQLMKPARLALATIILSLRPASSFAVTLYDAIKIAYQTNPTLRAQRAESRATDETYIQAKSGLGPQVNLNAQLSYQTARNQQFRSVLTGNYNAGTGSAGLSVVQPIYTSGMVGAQIRGAGATVLAGRENLRQAENQLIQNVITAYLDVRRHRAIEKIYNDEIASLALELKETSAKGIAGQLTRTDVAQAEARNAFSAGAA